MNIPLKKVQKALWQTRWNFRLFVYGYWTTNER